MLLGARFEGDVGPSDLLLPTKVLLLCLEFSPVRSLFQASLLTCLWALLQLGVAMASAAEVSFNWTGFISAMVSNLTFSFRAVLGKKYVPHLSCI